jgi:hypothetical protein
MNVKEVCVVTGVNSEQAEWVHGVYEDMPFAVEELKKTAPVKSQTLNFGEKNLENMVITLRNGNVYKLQTWSVYFDISRPLAANE